MPSKKKVKFPWSPTKKAMIDPPMPKRELIKPIDLDALGTGSELTKRALNPELLNEGVGAEIQHIDAEQSHKTFHMVPSESQTEFDSGLYVPSTGLGRWKWPNLKPWPVIYGPHYNPCLPPFPTPSRWPKGSFRSMMPKAVRPTPQLLVKKNKDRPNENFIERGYVLSFSRTRGYGWCISDFRNDQPMIFHVADIKCDYVPRRGDRVFFRVMAMPPKGDRLEAVHLRIVEFGPGVHVQWKTPVSAQEKVWGGKTDYMVT